MSQLARPHRFPISPPHRRAHSADVLGRVRRAAAALADSQTIVLVDENRGEGDLVLAAGSATTASVAFMVRHTSGVLAVALSASECDRLGLPPMWPTDSPGANDSHSVTVDAAAGIGTGASAADRAHTARLLASAKTVASDLARPGHVQPLRVRSGGVTERARRGEASVDAVRLAGVAPAAVLAGVVSTRRPEQMASLDELVDFAEKHEMAWLSVTDLHSYRVGW